MAIHVNVYRPPIAVALGVAALTPAPTDAVAGLQERAGRWTADQGRTSRDSAPAQEEVQ